MISWMCSGMGVRVHVGSGSMGGSGGGKYDMIGLKLGPISVACLILSLISSS